MPRMPETVRMLAPSNLDTSSWLLNMPPMKAVCLCTLKGVPFSFSFFMIRTDASRFNTTPVAQMRHDCKNLEFISVCKMAFTDATSACVTTLADLWIGVLWSANIFLDMYDPIRVISITLRS